MEKNVNELDYLMCRRVSANVRADRLFDAHWNTYNLLHGGPHFAQYEKIQKRFMIRYQAEINSLYFLLAKLSKRKIRKKGRQNAYNGRLNGKTRKNKAVTNYTQGKKKTSSSND